MVECTLGQGLCLRIEVGQYSLSTVNGGADKPVLEVRDPVALAKAILYAWERLSIHEEPAPGYHFFDCYGQRGLDRWGPTVRVEARDTDEALRKARSRLKANADIYVAEPVR